MGYDAAGQRRTETLPGGATTLSMGVDAEGRTTALTDTTSGVGTATSLFGYNPNDQPVTRTLPGGTGVRETTTYDANGRVTGVVANGPGGTAQTAQTAQTAHTRLRARAALATQARYGVNVGALALVNPTLSSRYALGYDDGRAPLLRRRRSATGGTGLVRSRRSAGGRRAAHGERGGNDRCGCG